MKRYTKASAQAQISKMAERFNVQAPLLAWKPDNRPIPRNGTVIAGGYLTPKMVQEHGSNSGDFSAIVIFRNLSPWQCAETVSHEFCHHLDFVLNGNTGGHGEAFQACRQMVEAAGWKVTH